MTQEQRKGVMCDICNEDLRVDVNKKRGRTMGRSYVLESPYDLGMHTDLGVWDISPVLSHRSHRSFWTSSSSSLRSLFLCCHHYLSNSLIYAIYNRASSFVLTPPSYRNLHVSS